MKHKTKQLIALALGASVLSGAAGCGSTAASTAASGSAADTGDLTKITLCLDWTPNTNHTGFYAADALGYYADEGIEIEIVQPPENGAAQMCASGQAQFAIDAQDTLAPVYCLDDPLPVTAVAALIQHNTSGILSRAGEGMDRPKGLENHTYSTWDSASELAIMQYVVEKDGGDWNKVTLIPNDITDEPAALAAHQTDAVWVFYGWSFLNAQIENVDCDFFYFRDIDDVFDYYTPVLIANDSFLADDPDTAKAFLRATRKGYEYAMENPEDAADLLIAGDTTGSLTDARDLVVSSQTWLADQYQADADQWGYIDPSRWNAHYKWLYDNKLVEKDISDNVGFSDEYLPE